MRFVGDIHGSFQEYKNLITGIDSSIQVGDFGLGFQEFPNDLLNLPGKHRFIRGNHDNPNMCKEHPWYLGDYGYYVDGIFYLSGAFSRDYNDRIIGIDLWENEELSMYDLYDALNLYEKSKPKIMITHDCPTCVKIDILRMSSINSKTNQALQTMLEIYSPDLWIFGHYHRRINEVVRGTRFICLEKFGVFDL